MKSTRFAPLLAAVVALLLAFLVFGPLAYKPGSYIFQTEGDAMKNYYTFGYHLRYDSDFWRFGGMAYPEGDHVIFSDAQPLLSGLLQQVNHSIMAIGFHGAIGWHNGLLWLGLALGAFKLCRLLLHFGVSGWYAVVGGVGLACLSPQLSRLVGHYALAYICAIPWLWLSLLKAQEKPVWPKGWLPAMLIFCFSLVHPYYLGIGLLFGSAFYLVQFLADRKAWKQHLLRFGVHVLLPLLLFQLLLLQTDSAADRPAAPWGFLNYRADPYGLYYPFHSERLFATLPQAFHRRPNNGLEGEIYLGIATLAFLLLFALRLLWGLACREKADVLSLPRQLALSLAAAFLLLLFSMGVPFIFGLEDLVKYIGPLRQFRGISRFSWVFFYVGGVAALVWFFRIFKSSRMAWRYAALLPVGLLFMEGILQLNETFARLKPTEAIGQPDLPLDYGRYQAILPCPVFYEGAEALGAATHSGINAKTFVLSMQTGLPTLASAMSRTSRRLALQLLPLAYEPYRSLPFTDKLPNRKPLLMITPEAGELRSLDKTFLNYARRLGSSNGFVYYELPYMALIQMPRDLIREKTQEAERLLQDGRALKEAEFIYSSFDGQPSDTPYVGRGAAAFPGGKERRGFFEGKLPAGGDSFTVSFWMYLAKGMQPTQFLGIEERNAKGEILAEASRRLNETLKVIDGNWGLVEYDFIRKAPGSDFKICIYSDNSYLIEAGRLLVDEMTIRPVNAEAVIRRKDGVLWNSRYYPNAAR